MTSSDVKEVAAIEGLFTWQGKEATLIGSHCKGCGGYQFPRSFTCNNPTCKNKDVEDVALSRRGTLWSYSVQFYEPPPPFKSLTPTFEPFAVGLIEIPEGLKILGRVVGTDINSLKIGMKLEIVAQKLFVDEQGSDAIGWAFRPV